MFFGRFLGGGFGWLGGWVMLTMYEVSKVSMVGVEVLAWGSRNTHRRCDSLSPTYDHRDHDHNTEIPS